MQRVARAGPAPQGYADVPAAGPVVYHPPPNVRPSLSAAMAPARRFSAAAQDAPRPRPPPANYDYAATAASQPAARPATAAAAAAGSDDDDDDTVGGEGVYDNANQVRCACA